MHFLNKDLRKAGDSDEITGAIDYLTHRDGEDYDQFIDRVKGNPLAVKVTIADFEDNLNLRRIEGKISPFRLIFP